jgi:hypothetical protein
VTGARALVAAGLLGAAGCATTVVTPAEIRRAAVDEAARAAVIATWREAVDLANGFLGSPSRRTLPPGRFELDDELGMSFVTPHGTWPIAVHCNGWGDVCVATGFAAQEREYGFVVGEVPPERDRAVDNSLFATGSGWRKPADSVARLILHETTHVVWRHGTVGFWNGVAYYLEAIFLFRYADHSDERRPNATDEEFTWWYLERDFARHGEVALSALHEVRDEHLAAEHDGCRHGPFEDPLPTAPVPLR